RAAGAGPAGRAGPDPDDPAARPDPEGGAGDPPHHQLEGGQTHREHRPGDRRGVAAAGLGPERHARRFALGDQHHRRSRRPRAAARSGRRPRRGEQPEHRTVLRTEPRQHSPGRAARSLRSSDPDPPMRAARGFTLLEVIIAVAVTAMMGALIGAAFQSGYRTKELVENEADRYRSLRTATDRMVREISAAFVSDHYDLKRFRDQNDRPTNFIGARDRLLFSSMAHQRLYADAKESDQMVVEYFTRSTSVRGGQARTDLIRRENPSLDERMDKGGHEDVLIEGVKRIDFAYWDSDKKDWVDEWDTRRLERKSILPVRVRIGLTALDETGKEVHYVTQTPIVLNTEIPRF